MTKKKKIIWLVIIVVIVIVIIAIAKDKTEETQYITEEAAWRNLVKTVSATGSVKSAEEIDLSFSSSGRINRLNVGVGDKVKSGQVLAQLNTAMASAEVANAQANVAAAQADLERIESGASTEDVAVTEQQLAQAQADLQQVKNSLANLLKEKADKLSTYRETALNNLATKNFYSRASLDIINTILEDNDAASLLSIQDMQYKNFVVSKYSVLNNRYAGISNEIFAYNLDSVDSDILGGLTTLIGYQTDIAVLLTNTYLMLENSLTSSSFTQTELDTYKSNVRIQQTNLDTALTSLQTAKTNLSNSVVYYNGQISTAEDVVVSKQEAMALAQAQLSFKKAGPRSFEVSMYEAKLQQAQASLQTALARLSDYIIKAPIEGTVVRLDKKIGEQTSVSESVVTIIGKSNLEIEVDIPEADIAEVQLGDQVEITLDAYGSALLFNGHVTFIDPAETTISDVVYYQVKVAFDLPDQAVKTGMTANVDIMIEQKDGILAVPARAVFEIDNQKQIRILIDGEVSTKEIKTGLKDDTGYIEVLSGINIGDIIIIGQNNGK